MANTIKVKRGLDASTNLQVGQQGEPLFATDTERFYIGTGSGRKLINPSGVPASEADKLSTARQISTSGAATGSVMFDGSQSVDIVLTLANSGVTAGTYTKLTVNAKGLVTAAEQITISDVGGLLVGGKLAESLIPALAITEVFVVPSETAMLALTAQTGDVAVRSDEDKSYILQASPASTLSNWVLLRSPGGAVLSVNGMTGAVTVTATHVGLGNVTNESKATMFTSPTFTGTPTAPTPLTEDNSQQLATTAFVKAQGYLDANSIIDGGQV